MASSNKEERSLTPAKRERHWPVWPEEMDRFFDRAVRGFGLWPWRRWERRPWLWREQGWLPAIDVLERDDKIIVRADIPGLKREDIKVAVEDDALVVSGTRKEEKESRDQGRYYAERTCDESLWTVVPRPQSAKEGKRKEAPIK